MKKNISLEIEGMLKVREDKIANIKKVLKDTKLQDITRKSLENEIYRLENEIETIVEVDTRCNLSFNDVGLIELSDEEINFMLDWHRGEELNSELLIQMLNSLYDKLSDNLNKKMISK